MKSVSKSFAILLIMLIGVAAGILLIGQTQEFREKAKQEKKVKYKICHKTGSSENPWQQIEVDEAALKAHIDHGDIIGECPKPEEPGGEEPDGEETPSEPEPTSSTGDEATQPTAVQPTSSAGEAAPRTNTTQGGQGT